jgi:serine/threonine protein phosphatase PrpC
MSTNSPDPKAPKPGGLLARLRGMYQSLKPAEEATEEPPPLPTFDVPEGAAEPGRESPAATLPVAVPAEAPVPEAVPVAEAAPVAEPAEAPEPAEEEQPVAEPAEPVAAPEAPPRLCPVCTSPRRDSQAWCDSCGYMFPPDPTPRPAAATAGPVAEAVPADPVPRLRDRYELGTPIGERGGVTRFRGLDRGAGTGEPVPVTIVRMAVPEPVEQTQVVTLEEPDENAVGGEDDGDILPSFDEEVPVGGPITEPIPAGPAWPSVAWERNLLEIAQYPALPAVLDTFTEDGYEYLVEELPTGQSLWDAWDDPEAPAARRYGLLKQVAEALFHLHQGSAILEGLRPDLVVVTPDGRARLTDLSDLLPLPLPPDAGIRATLYTAPELLAGDGAADARADLYSFGAMLYSLHVGRELTERDFERPGTPQPFIPRFPDVHPLFGRLVTKTFTREVAHRLPTDEAGKEDPTGFTELMNILDLCGRTMDDVRLEIASWTTTGIVRTGNEDAFALLHSTESRLDDVGEMALLLLCDGMGGYDAGEVAAAMAIRALRKQLLQHKMFRPLTGGPAFAPLLPPHLASRQDPAAAADEAPEPFDVEKCKKLLKDALKEVNRQVYQASRLPGGGRRTMGCTAEAVVVTGRHVVVGHVGDSRTYHLHEGRLVQLTRDQTLVNRLVELGTLTPEEAENHPRKNELQQAIGGQPEVEPGVYHGEMKPGDWVVVCSDGVSNHVNNEDLQHMLQSEATSAEMAARRLVNFVLINGATDNATIVVVRGT